PELLDRVEWLDTPPDQPWRGVLLANEVVDALAVERFKVGEDGIRRAAVTLDGDGFAWTTVDAPASLTKAAQKIADDHGLEPGYVSELCMQLPAWLEAVTASLQQGVALFVDYGYPRGEYYLPERSDGTLVCHYRHRAHGDPFLWPGLQDISAFVDFTALAEAGEAAGLELAGYTSQALFLLALGITDRLPADAMSPGAALGAEARRLTLPGEMGERFQVMALSRGIDAPLSGFATRDLRHRL
ncbi:MAG: SAM-dependent methyltransferase, partial [Xanthomonadales bacterium]|nr:SAM-dependent methyltransferase [Xanthomonadales bacterium]